MPSKVNNIAAPASPKIPTVLEPWSETDKTDVESDTQQLIDVDFTKVRNLQMDSSVCERSTLLAATLDTFRVIDSRLSKVEASGLRSYRLQIRRVFWEDSRISGADFAEATFEDCVFKNCKLDEVNFRSATFHRVQFVDCVLDGADFSNATLSHVTLTGSSLVETNFAAARCASLDVSDIDITQCKGIVGLKGATISNTQLIQIAPLLAAELGFSVKDSA
jgi:uncharacterized protein YjbI with pentapeptide repeats